MSDKKVKLDELPDEGSSHTAPPIPVAKKTLKKDHDPRLDRLKNKSDEEKVTTMKEGWHFDRKVQLYGWLSYLLIVLGMQYAGFYQMALDDLKPTEQGLSDFAFVEAIFIEPFKAPVVFVLQNPMIFLLLTPFLFKFRIESEYSFDINFDGISTVRKVLSGERQTPQRIFLKWKEITGAEHGVSGKRDVLKLYSPDGLVAEVIWDIEQPKKAAVAHILKGLIPKEHPLRILLEKDQS